MTVDVIRKVKAECDLNTDNIGLAKDSTLQTVATNTTTLSKIYVDSEGKLRTGIVEYIKLYAQNPRFASVTVGTSTTAPTTYNTLLMYPLPLSGVDTGNDQLTSSASLTVTAAAGTTNTNTTYFSITKVFVGTLTNKIDLIKGKALIRVTITISASSGTTTLTSLNLEFGKVDISTGTFTAIHTKSLTVGDSTTGSLTEAFTDIFDIDTSLNDGELFYLKVNANCSLTVTANASSSTTSVTVTGTGTVAIDVYRGSDYTCVLLPIVK